MGKSGGVPKRRGFKQEGPKKGARGRRTLKDQGTKGPKEGTNGKG